MFFLSIIKRFQILVPLMLVCIFTSPALYADNSTYKLNTLKLKNQKPDRVSIQFTDEEQAWLKANTSIRLGFNPDMLPLLRHHTDGNNSGILPDIFTQIHELTGLNIIVEVGPWHDIIDRAASGTIDGLLLCVPDLARAKGLLSTKEYISTMAVVFGRSDAPFTVNSLKDLKGKRIAYLRAVKFIENILTPLKSDVTAIAAETFIGALTMVLEGKADVALGMNFDTYLLHESVLTGIEPVFIDTSQTVKAVTAVRSEWPQLIGILNKGLTAIGEANINHTIRKWTQIESPVRKLMLSDSERGWLKDHPIVRIGADPAWEPIEFLDRDGTYKGLSIDYLKKIEPLLGIEFKFIQENWQDLIKRAKTKELDLFTCVAKTTEREEFLLFTEPYIQMPAGIFVQKDVAYITDLKMIAGEKISVVEGYAIHDYLASTYPDMNLVLVNTPEEGIRSVLSKEAFAFIDNVITTGHIISRKGYLGLKMVGEAPFDYAQRMGVRKDWPELRDILEKAIATIPDGERNAIYNQWLPTTYEKPADYSLVWKIGSGCLIIICLIFFWNRKLATEVNKQTTEYRKSENRFRSTFDNAGIGMGLVSLEGQWLRVNQALSGIVGYNKEELVKLTFQDITYPDDLKANLEFIGDLTDGTANSYEMEMRYLHKDGRVIWIQLNVSILRGENDEPLNLLKQIQDITDRKYAEETLKDNQKFLDSIIEQSPYPTWISDTEGTMIRANPALKNVLNLSDEQLIGKYNVFQDKQVGAELLQQIRDAVESGKTSDYELEWVGEKAGIDSMETGNRVYCEGTIFPIYNQKDAITHAVITYKDVSEKKKAEEALRKSELIFSQMFEQSMTSTCFYNPEGTIVRVNDEFCKMFGVEEREILNSGYNLFNDQNIFDAGVLPLLKEIFEDKKTNCWEIDFNIDKASESTQTSTSKSGRIFLEVFGYPILNDKNDIEYVVLQHYDITDRKRTELSIERRIEALTKPLNHTGDIAFEDLFILEDIQHLQDEFAKATGVASIITQVDGTPITEPSNFCRLCIDIIRKTEKGLKNCFKSDAVIGRYNPEGPTIQQCMSGGLWDAGAGITVGGYHIANWLIGQVRDETQTKEKMKEYAKKISADEHEFIAAFNEVPSMSQEQFKYVAQVLFTLSNQLSKYAYQNILQARFIKERELAEEEKQKLESQLRQLQKIESIGTLAGGIAHDFNNLLYPIIGMSELLLEDLPPDSPEHENAQEIFNAGKRAGDLVKQILAFSRQSEHKMEPVRIQKILKEVLKLSRSTIPTNIEIHENIQQDCGLIMADSVQIHQIVMNLITNAFHAVEEQNGTIDIALKEITLENNEFSDSVLLPGPYIRLSVSDNGIGMPESIINKIFEPYFTTKEMDKGTGLGLAVVYGIIKEHKGDIKVYSEVGTGTTFNIYLPLIKKPSDIVTVNNVSGAVTGTESILLVDDEVSVAKLEGQMLSRLGYQVTVKTNSGDALNVFRSNPESFDLVVSDMTMPDMTGDQLSKEILLIKPDTSIIICTGFSERINKEQAESIGVKGFLMKPVVKLDMAQMVRKVLDESKKFQEKFQVE